MRALGLSVDFFGHSHIVLCRMLIAQLVFSYVVSYGVCSTKDANCDDMLMIDYN